MSKATTDHDYDEPFRIGESDDAENEKGSKQEKENQYETQNETKKQKRKLLLRSRKRRKEKSTKLEGRESSTTKSASAD